MNITINNYYFGAHEMSAVKTQVALLAAAVTQLTTVQESAVALINGLGEQLKTATDKLAETGADVSELKELTDHITAESEALANAVHANTEIITTVEGKAVTETAQPSTETATENAA